MLAALKRRFIKYISKVYDPLIDLKIGNQTIKTFMSHQLRQNVVLYPDYNYNLPRLIKYTLKFKPNTKVIDIGANIGDTTAFIKNFTDVPVLCIDGEARYIEILKKNVAQYNNVAICKALVGAENMDSKVSLKTERGTAFVAESSDVTRIRTLENILEEFKDFQDANILKSDTDGFDTIIVRACKSFLEKNKPMLFLEYDPFLITRNNDDPFAFIDFLKERGYYWFIFYVNNGDYLLSCSIEQKPIIDQLIHYFSGRQIASFMDIAVFAKEDKELFDYCANAEIAHFKKVRNY